MTAIPQGVSPRKMAAIAAAINAYIEAHQPQIEPELGRAPMPTGWGTSGRQETMQLGALLQRRAMRSVR